MSFYTSLTGINAATALLGVTSNNIANVGTTGFKRSRADFGDIFATSPLQKASSTVGQGVSLKQVSQEFGQGNIAFSANALDLAITGDGFFPLRSADGLSSTFTRNGSFMLNEQFNVVNSAGQRLMAATVDSTGSANINERVVLTIPQKTSGEAKQTTNVDLGLNFPADASVITNPFSRTDPTSFNKSTAFTVYDNGGNGYLATIYYVKTQNANQNSPFNKWQTFVYVGADEVAASLVQATNPSGDELYVNQYGQIKPFGEVKDELTTAKTLLISLDELTDKKVSTPASLSGITVPTDFVSGTQSFATFTQTSAAGVLPVTHSGTKLANLFSVKIDDSAAFETIDLSYLAGSSLSMSGVTIAAEVTKQLNRKFGDEFSYDFTDTDSSRFAISSNNLRDPGATGKSIPVDIDFRAALQTLQLATDPVGAITKVTIEQATTAMQNALDTAAAAMTATGRTAVVGVPPQASVSGIAPNNGLNDIRVAYDFASQSFKFTQGIAELTLGRAATTVTGATSAVNNLVLGLGATAVQLDENGLSGIKMLPNGNTTDRLKAEQRYGMKMVFDPVNKSFSLLSGTTGDRSSLALTVNPSGTELLGLSDGTVARTNLATRGIASLPAVATGTSPTINVTTNFAVDETNNKFVVTVDGIKSTVVIPPSTDYSLESFMSKLQKGINNMGSNDAVGASSTVSGVTVSFNFTKNAFVFTTGTTGSDSFIKISGSNNWGLDQVEAGRGSTTGWIKPTQYKDVVSGALQPKYIDKDGKETTNGDGFISLPEWSPIFLDKGELTFDTGGKLVSPVKGTQLETVFLEGGKGALTININYGSSTQFSSPFAVLSQSQDGTPEGDLVGVTIGNDGLVNASFSNGTQKSLAKILLVNFSSPAGLRQVGDSSFLASATSGKPILGTAGSAGFGTLRAGATERANVDLTQELVDLITAQRNFQANAKAIETSSTMTSAIINLRS